MRAKKISGLILATVLTIRILLFGSNSWAESNEDFNSWQNTLAPFYLWGVSMSGTMTSGPITPCSTRAPGNATLITIVSGKLMTDPCRLRAT